MLTKYQAMLKASPQADNIVNEKNVLSDYSVGIIIVESEGHVPVKSGTVQKACNHLLGHCFGRHAEVAAQCIRLWGRSRQSNNSGCSGDPRLERTGRARPCEWRDLLLAERSRRSTWS